MDAIQKFIFDNFYAVFAFCAIWAFGGMAWELWKRKRRGLFGDAPRNIIYEENNASGRSLKNWRTKWGGARNCLRLLISESELWVTPVFPFSALAESIDLDHRIPLVSIQEVNFDKGLLGTRCTLKYKDETGATHLLEVSPKKPEEFMAALNNQRAKQNTILHSVGD